MTPITIACAADILTDGGHLAACIGAGPKEAETFVDAPTYPDAQGNTYAVPSGLVSDDFLARAMAPLVRPGWDSEPYAVNMTGANRARVVLDVWLGEGPVPQVQPGRIVAVVGLDPAAAREAMGLRNP